MDTCGTDNINGVGLAYSGFYVHGTGVGLRPQYFKDAVNESIGQGSLQLFVDGELSDVTVKVGNEEYLCHRFVLASVSEFFRAFFRNEFSSDHVTLYSDHVSPRSFALLLDMLYKKSDGVVDTDIATDMLISAVFLQIQFLQKHCEEFLVRTMKPATCPDLWQFAELYTLEILERGAKKMATTMFLEVSQSEAFDQLPLRFLLVLLSSEDLVVTKEDHVADGIIKWVTADKEEREKHLAVLLPFVTFINVSDSGIHDFGTPCSYTHHIQGYLIEALTYKLEGATKQNSVLRREILARQEKRVSRADVDVVFTAFGRREESEADTLISLWADSKSLEADFPEFYKDLGGGFATCVWRNELYVSGGFDAPSTFKVYNSGTAEWKDLPDMEIGRYRHSMVAVSKVIFLLGGLPKTIDDESDDEDEESDNVTSVEERKPVCDISVYSTETKTWKTFPQLLEPVTDVTAAVLGHRIYVIGGNDADGQPTSLVQCVDTLTASVYRAGSLPSPTSGARAVRDGSAIYVVVPEGHVYQIKENSFLADQREKQLLESQENGDGSTLASEETDNRLVQLSAITNEAQKRMAATFRETRQRVSVRNYRETNNCSDQTTLQQSSEEGEPSLTQQDGEKEEEAGDKRHDSSDENAATLMSVHPLTSKENALSSVSLKRLAVVPGRRHFGACLHKGELLVAGGQDAEGANVDEVIGVDLHTGTVTTKPQTLHMSRCDLHVINVPKLSNKVDFRFTFRCEDIPNEKYCAQSSNVKIGTEKWHMSAKRGEGFLKVYLHRRSKDLKRNWMVRAKCEVWLVPARHTQQPISPKTIDRIFKDSENVGYGTGQIIRMEYLTNPEKGYINAKGEVTIQASVTITKPPQLEESESESESE